MSNASSVSFFAKYYYTAFRFVAVKGTTSFNTEEVAREVAPDQRQCLVEGEKKLKYFQHYSRSACMVECATRIMHDNCQCRPYFLRGSFNYLTVFNVKLGLILFIILFCLSVSFFSARRQYIPFV